MVINFKKIQWCGNENYEKAECLTGIYNLCASPKLGFYELHHAEFVVSLEVSIERYPTREAAKEAAQEIHEKALQPYIETTIDEPVISVKGMTDKELLENLRLAAVSIREYMPETLPANEDGKIHFGRLIAESAAEAIEDFLSYLKLKETKVTP